MPRWAALLCVVRAGAEAHAASLIPPPDGPDSSAPSRPPTRNNSVAVGTLAVVLVLTGISMIGMSTHGAATPTLIPPAPQAAQAAGPPPVLPAATSLDRSPPVRLTYQRLGIETALLSVGLNPDRTAEVPPKDPGAPAGWYRNLAAPGQSGSAVILGHVDTTDGPGVFFNLGSSQTGDRILVEREDGRTGAFTVERVESFPRADFPTDQVYGRVDHAALRLVTCGGFFDRDNGGYQENVVVFATLTEVFEAGEAVPQGWSGPRIWGRLSR